MKRKIFREDILKAGRDIMFLNGYNATGIKEITDSIEIPKGSFYNHFSSKEAFGLEVLQNYTDNGINWHKKSLIQTKISPLESLQELYSQMIDGYIERGNFDRGCMMSNFSTELADTHPAFRELLDKQFNEIEAILVSTLINAKAKGEISNNINPDSTGAFILNSWHGALVRMKSTTSEKPLRDFYDLIFSHILH